MQRTSATRPGWRAPTSAVMTHLDNLHKVRRQTADGVWRACSLPSVVQPHQPLRRKRASVISCRRAAPLFALTPPWAIQGAPEHGAQARFVQQPDHGQDHACGVAWVKRHVSDARLGSGRLVQGLQKRCHACRVQHWLPAGQRVRAHRWQARSGGSLHLRQPVACLPSACGLPRVPPAVQTVVQGFVITAVAQPGPLQAHLCTSGPKLGHYGDYKAVHDNVHCWRHPWQPACRERAGWCQACPAH